MKIKLLFLLCAALIFAPTGCVSVKNGTASNITQAGYVFMSFNDVWIVTRNAYLGFKVRQAQGKVSDSDAADVDAAWNTFRSGFAISLDVAQKDKTQFTPMTVKKLANDVLDLIAATL